MRSKSIQLHIARLMAAVMVLLLVFSAMPTAWAAETSGSCGKDVQWTLYSGILTISGKGAIENYKEYDYAPWYDRRDTIRQVVVEKGITRIGSFAFFGLENAKNAVLSDSVESIGEFAFYGCEKMEAITLHYGLQEIGRSAFEQCRGLKAVNLPGSLRTIRSAAFYRCESLLNVTVPASVNTMEQRVFTYCSGLRSASILANIGQLPYWTFYGCYALTSVSLSSSITELGVDAFAHCDNLVETKYGGVGDAAQSVQQQIQTALPEMDSFKPGESFVAPSEQTYTSTKKEQQDGKKVTIDQILFEGPDSTVDTRLTHTKQGVIVEIEAVLKNESGWTDVEKQLTKATKNISKIKTVQIHIYLQSGSILKGADLARFAGRDIQLVIHTAQGAVWYINCRDLHAAQLRDTYDLSYTLKPLTKPTKAQEKAIEDGVGYLLVFNGTVNFKSALELPLGNPRYIASLFYKEKISQYTLKQKVLIDSKGSALFYLEDVQEKAECLIGVNIVKADKDSSSTLENVIVPDSAADGQLPVEWIDHDYYISGIKSSWGITIGQLTLILVGVMVAAVIVVGVVVRVVYKKNASKSRNKDHLKKS